jgi:hypothetical protein
MQLLAVSFCERLTRLFYLEKDVVVVGFDEEFGLLILEMMNDAGRWRYTR